MAMLKKLRDLGRSMDVVWIGGKLHAKRQDSVMGKSGYHMDAFKIEPYVAPKQ